MRKLIALPLFVLSIGLLSPGAAQAYPWHWPCYTDYVTHPKELEIHDQHGNGECGNYDASTGTYATKCDTGCSGNCPLGEWDAHLDCYIGSPGQYRGCQFNGTIRCDNGLHRDYVGTKVNSNGVWPKVSQGPDSIEIDGVAVCDCTMSEYTNSYMNCGAPY